MQSKSDLWSFSLHVYGKPEVAAACLELQDSWAADVNLLLFGAWLGSRGRRLDAAEVEQAMGAVAAWHGEVVVGLRNLRRRLKSGPPPAPAPHTEALREAIKSSELAAERIEQQVLEALAADLPGVGRDDPSAAAISNILLILRGNVADLSGDAVADPVARIVSASIPLADRDAIAVEVARWS